MPSGSKTGTQIYFLFLSKRPFKRIASRFPNGAPMERDNRLQGIFYVSFDIFLYLKGPKKGASLHGSQKWGAYGNIHPFQSLTYLSESPVKEPSLARYEWSTSRSNRFISWLSIPVPTDVEAAWDPQQVRVYLSMRTPPQTGIQTSSLHACICKLSLCTPCTYGI